MSFSVVHVQVISEEIDDPSLDRKYRVKVIRPFKISSDVSEVRTVWIRNDSCQCHLLIPEKRYLLMGQLTMHEGSTKTINGIELGRDSYVEEWRESMIRRILEIKKRGCLRIPTSQTPKVAITPPSEGIGHVLEEVSLGASLVNLDISVVTGHMQIKF